MTKEAKTQIVIDNYFKSECDVNTSIRKAFEKGFRIGVQKGSVVAEPVKHGHWVEVQRIHETDHTAICECSLCGDTVWVYDGQRAWNYCPNCGAKMDEVKE